MQTEWNFDCGNIGQSITLKPGRYKFECWGARGGATGTLPSSGSYYYGKGGYSSGELTLRKESTLYAYVGYDGKKGYDFNCGGYSGSASGGGATDIRLFNGAWDNEQGLLSRIIVAGGGGGTKDTYDGGHGGGLKGGIGRGWNGSPAHGGTQFEGGMGHFDDGSCDGSFGKGAKQSNPSIFSGSGGGWFGGAVAGYSSYGSGGGSGYVLTKDSYKPQGYIPTSEYYMTNPVLTTGGNTTVVGDYSDGRAKITLLQALPFLTVSSYNSTQATFKADHTDPTLLTKIEVFIDDILKETITTDLTLEKTINYTLEDNALHTLKIVVTDSSNTTVEKVLSISNGIAPLPAGSCLEDVTNKWKEIGTAFKNGKTSIVNTLALKNVPASLDNTLVEFSEKIKTFFDSSDASTEELQNQITNLNNQLSQRKRYATGVVEGVPTDYLPWRISTNLSFDPTLVFISCNVTYYNYCSIYYSTNKSTVFCVPIDFSQKVTLSTNISSVSASGFLVRFFNSGIEMNKLDTRPNINRITWYAYE
ncbi:hypothetical protein C4R87_19225 [Clostridioides difficile]|nr:hypothetical protein [Clostridioides difficile]